MATAPYSKFGKTVDVEVKTYVDGKRVEDSTEWDEELWVERDEDSYALLSRGFKGKRVRVVNRQDFIRALNKV